MSAIQGFFAGLAIASGLVLYVAGWVLPEPPVWASLFAREPVTVTASTVEVRPVQPPALPVIDVRGASGETVIVSGYHWMSDEKAEAIVAAYPVGASVELPRWGGRIWGGLSGILDWVLVVFSALAVFLMQFGLWMMWKLRAA